MKHFAGNQQYKLSFGSPLCHFASSLELFPLLHELQQKSACHLRISNHISQTLRDSEPLYIIFFS